LYRIYDLLTGKYGYIDNKGNVVIKPQFEDGQELFIEIGYVILNGKITISIVLEIL